MHYVQQFRWCESSDSSLLYGFEGALGSCGRLALVVVGYCSPKTASSETVLVMVKRRRKSGETD
jgi:hypothetical protein